MKLIAALLKHAFIAMQLEHDGAGLPTKLWSALMLVSIYVALVYANSSNFGDETLGLAFVIFIYLFVLRTQVIGLLILIGVISGSIAFMLSLFGDLSALQLVMLNAMEYMMVFGGLINAIKRYAKIT
jgi:hypothetical protein